MGGANSYATKKYATYGSPASNGSWDSETSTYAWTGNSNNLMSLFTFSNGELKDFNSIIFTTDNLSADDVYRLYFHGPNKEIAFYSAGTKTIVFAERAELNGVDLSTVTGISFGGASGDGSIKITGKPYISKPMSLIWNDNGEAEIDLTDLTASNGFSFNDQTGELTKTGNGELSVNFPAGGVDLTNLTGFSVSYTGTNLFGGFKIGTSEKTKDFYSNPTGRDDLASHITVENVGNPSAITRWNWWQNANEGTMTISSIKLKGGVIKANPCGEKAIETLERKYYEGEEWKTGTVSYSYGSNISNVIGDGNATQDEYIDLSGYNELRMYVSSGDIRVFAVKKDGFTSTEDGYIITKEGVKQNGQWGGIQDTNHKLVKNGDYYYITIDDLKAACGGQAKLIGVKAEYNNTVNVSKVIVIGDSEFNYSISGTGALSSSAIAALADPNATSYDATGVAGSDIDLTSVANKNALFKANAGVLSNTKNVIVSGVCANLALTDGNYPFKAPADFTATSVSYNRNFTAGTRSTVCLPFALTAVEAAAAGTFYELSGVNVAGTQLTFEAVSGGTTAYKPYIFEAKADGTPFSAYSSKAIAITPATFTGTTVEGYTLTGVLTGSSDVAADNEGKTVYGWSGNSGQEGTFVKVGTGVAINPFRAYVVYDGGVSSPARIAARFVGGSVTGISEVSEAQNVLNPDGKYIENGKIVIVKNGVKYNAAGAQVK